MAVSPPPAPSSIDLSGLPPRVGANGVPDGMRELIGGDFANAVWEPFSLPSATA